MGGVGPPAVVEHAVAALVRVVAFSGVKPEGAPVEKIAADSIILLAKILCRLDGVEQGGIHGSQTDG